MNINKVCLATALGEKMWMNIFLNEYLLKDFPNDIANAPPFGILL